MKTKKKRQIDGIVIIIAAGLLTAIMCIIMLIVYCDIQLAHRAQNTQNIVITTSKESISQAIPEIHLDDQAFSDSVPLFLQWDERWGYIPYGNEAMSISGCGPTCLSMVCVYLTKDPQYHPGYIAEFSKEHGYCVPGSGSAWTLISQGGKELGLDVTELPMDKSRILNHLENGDPIICVMGPGDFTSTGHFIVMTGYENGKITINDPNSIENSQQLWEFDSIRNQIRNLWVFQ